MAKKRSTDRAGRTEAARPEPAGLVDPVLERTRTRSTVARSRHEAAQVEVERRQLALVANDARVRAREQAIEQAKRALAENRKALKRLKRERPALERKFTAANADAERAGRKARKHEDEYDDAMLRHVVEREKSVDRALHTV